MGGPYKQRPLGRPYKPDGYWFLKDLVREAIDETKGGLSGVCEAAGCVGGRKSISFWLIDERPNAEGVRKVRALPDNHAAALMMWLSKDERFAEEAKKVRVQAMDWFNSIKRKVNLVQVAEESEEELVLTYPLRCFWYVNRYLGI